MTLPKYSPSERCAAAQSLKINEQYLYQIFRGIKIPSATLARRINEYDSKALLKDLRPNDWKALWPEQRGDSIKSSIKK
jgi:hypothetical protein